MIVYLSFEWVDYHWVDFVIVWFNLNAPDIGIRWLNIIIMLHTFPIYVFIVTNAEKACFYVCKAKNVNFGRIEHC